MFRKPKRNIRSQRSKINDSDEEGDVEITKDHKLGRNGSSFKENIEIEEDVSLKEIQSNISKFKEEKLDKKKKKSSKVGNKEEPGGNKTNVAGSTLSFGEDLEGGECFSNMCNCRDDINVLNLFPFLLYCSAHIYIFLSFVQMTEKSFK